MTDEQKSLDYCVKNVCTNCAELGECGKGVNCDFLRTVRNCYEEVIEIGREEIKNKTESLNSKLKNICEWETDIEDILSDFEKGKYDDNEHQCVIDMFIIMNGILNDIRSVKYCD